MKPSPASSIRSGSATPSNQASNSHGHSSGKEHGFGHLLRHMFETPRHASFAVSVTIHELSNVPQLTGNFAVRWKFRGHRPHDADKMLENPQKRIKPNENKQGGGTKGLRGVASAQSLRPSSTVSLNNAGPSASNSSLRQGNGSGTRITGLHPSHANSLPPALDQAPSTCPPRDSTSIDLARDTDSNASGPSSRAPSISSNLSVPGQQKRGRTGTVSSRSGTAPPGLVIEAETRPGSRAGSLQSDNSGMDPLTPSSATFSHIRPRPILEGWTSPDSASRRGLTPMAEIHAHNVDWDWQVQHAVHIMLGKPDTSTGAQSKQNQTPNGTATPSNGAKSSGKNKPPARLGEGPTSDSGLKLEILQATTKGKGHQVFGYVNIDLAPFADLGPTARKFLLMDSKTNATIRITVDMKFIGGEQDWIAPPLVEGHLVTGVNDITVEEHLPDLQLLPTRSYSSDSTESSLSRPSQQSSKSTPPVSLNQQPTTSLSTSSSKHRYTTFEHHLRPEFSAKHRQRTGSGPLGRSSTIDSTTSSSYPRVINSQILTESPTSSPVLHPAQLSPVSSGRAPSGYFDGSDDPCMDGNLPGGVTKQRLSPIKTTGASSSPTRAINAYNQPAVLSPLSAEVERPLSPPISPVNTLLPDPQKGPNLDHLYRRHSHSPHHANHPHGQQHHRPHLHDRRPSEELQADLVIEGIFNPVASEEESPFTYVPEEGDEVGSVSPYDDESSDPSEPQEAVPENNVPAGRWDRIKRKVPLPHRPRETTVA